MPLNESVYRRKQREEEERRRREQAVEIARGGSNNSATSPQTSGNYNSTNSSTSSRNSSYGSQTGSQTAPAERALLKITGRKFTDRLDRATARDNGTGNTNKTRTLDRTNEKTYSRYDTEGTEKSNIRKNYLKDRAEFRKEHPVGRWLGAEGNNALWGLDAELAKGVDFFLPDVITPKKVQQGLDYYKKQGEEAQKTVEKERGGSVERTILGTVGGESLKNIPSATMAYLSGGASVGAQVAGKAVPSLYKASELTHVGNTFTRALNEVARTTGKNPMFWETFARTIGTTYEKEIENGADPVRATLSAYTNALLNAQIEVGGGVEVYDPSEDFLKAVARSAKEEGLEEVQQYAVENLVNKAMGSNTARWLSLTRGQDAVINPVDMAEQGFYGALSGGLMSGGRTALANARTEAIDSALNPVSAEAVQQGMADQRGLVNRGLVQERADEDGEQISTKAKTLAQDLQAQLDRGEALQPNQVKRLIREINKESNANEQSLERARVREVGKSLNEGSFVEETGLNLEQQISKQKDSALESRSREKAKAILGENASDNEVASVTKVVIGTANSSDIDTVLTKPSLKNAVADMVNEGADADSKIQIPINNAEARTVLENLTAMKSIANRNAILKETQEENDEDIKALLTNLNSGGKDLFANNLARGTEAIGDVYQNRFYRMYNEGRKDGADFEEAYGRLIAPLGSDVQAVFTRDFAQQIFAQGKASLATDNAKATAKSLAEKYANRSSGVTYENNDDSIISEAEKKGLEALAKAGNVEIRVMKNLTATDKDGKALLTKDGKELMVNGMYKDGTIYISANTKNKLVTVAKHELTHYIREMSPERYKELEDFVLKKWYKNDPVAMAKRIEEYQRLYKDATPEEAREEIIADASEAFFTDEATIQEAVSFSKKLGKAIHDGIKHILDAFTGDDRTYRGYGDFMKDLGILQEAERMWLEALEDTQQRKRNARGNATAEDYVDASTQYTTSDEKHSLVESDDEIERLNSEPTQKSYRAMALIDGKLYPPMATKVKDKNGKWVLQQGADIGQWLKSDITTDPKMFNSNGQFILKKDNDDTIPASYNPYIHSSDTMLNDQFATAYKRPNIVVVEGEIPTSELTNGKRAEHDLDDGRHIKAKDPTGTIQWKAGIVQGKLTGTRTVFLTNHFKPTRVVPDSEVARSIQDMVKGTDVAIPYNVVTPSLRQELQKLGVKMEQSKQKGYQVDLNAKLSVTAEEDQAYMDAVNRGDMKTAQRMVDEEAKRNGYNIKVFHGTPNETISASRGRIRGDDYKKLATDYADKLFPYVVFRNNGRLTGIYTSTDRGIADAFSYSFSRQGTVYDLYARADKPFTFDAEGNGWNNIPINAVEDLGISKAGRITLEDVSRSAKEQGYDAVVVNNVRETGSGDNESPLTTDVIVFSSTQLKSADPVTYDNKGDVIPLSQRFNESNEDIRYSLSAEDQDYMDAVNRGDMETAQKMVDEEAKKHGYDIKAYHGTNAQFTRFDPDKLGSKNFMAGSAYLGFFASKSKETAESYTGLNSMDAMATVFSSQSKDYMEKIKSKYNYDERQAELDNQREQFFENYRRENRYYEEVEDPIKELKQQFEQNRQIFVRKDGSDYFDNFMKDFEDNHRTSLIYDWNKKHLNDMYRAWEETQAYKDNQELEQKIYKEWEKYEIKRRGYVPHVLDLYLKMERPFVHDFKGEGRDTESFASRMAQAKEEGYDGCIFKNVADGADIDDIYTVFSNTQLKSADPVTYDDKGDVIPLSQRFNESNEDIRWSVSEDSDGNKLTKAQADYFKNSKVRDSKGNLLVMYHGSMEDFTVFQKDKIREIDYDAPFNGFWFTSEEREADPAFKDARFKKKVYLNITNPAPYEVWRQVNKQIEDEWFNQAEGKGVRETARSLNDELRMRLQDMGYDGVHFDGAYNFTEENVKEYNEKGTTTFTSAMGKKYDLRKSEYDDARLYPHNSWNEIIPYGSAEEFLEENSPESPYRNADVWVAFEPNQIKLTSNENPTEDADIRYSVTTENEPLPKGGKIPKSMEKWAKKVGLETLSKQDSKVPVNVSVRSLRSYWYAMNGRTDEARTVNNSLRSVADALQKLSVKYKYIGLDDAMNATVHYRTDEKGRPTSVYLTCQVKNAEYEINYDFTTICAKRAPLQKVLERFIKTEGERMDTLYDELKLDEEGMYKLRLILEQAGFEVSCIACFVEQNRYSQQAQAETVATDWNKALDEWARENGTRVSEHFNLASLDLKSIPFEEIKKGFTTYYRLMREWKNAHPKDSANVSVKNRMLIEAIPYFRKRMNPSEYASIDGQRALMAMGNKKTNLYNLLKRGQGYAKQSVPFVAYNGEVALLPDRVKNKSLFNYLMSIGGARAQSASDFQIEYVFDYMQMVADLSARRLPMHMYTKVIELAELFGKTGIKINLSAMCAVDNSVDSEYAGLKKVNGRWVYNISDQSIDYNKAVKLQRQEGYSKNIGIIMVTLSKYHMLKALGDKDVRYIIGYHSSKMPAVVSKASDMESAMDCTKINKTNRLNDKGRELFDKAMSIAKGDTELERYKNALRIFDDMIQREVSKEKADKRPRRGNEYSRYMTGFKANTADFDVYNDIKSTKDPRKTADNYIQYCMDNDLIPMYFPFAFHENYYKCEVYDFNMFDNNTGEYAPMEAVQNIYPDLDMTKGETDTTKFMGRVSKYMNAQNKKNKELEPKYQEVERRAKETLRIDIDGNDHMDMDAMEIDPNEYKHRADVLTDIRDGKASVSEVEDSEYGRLQKENETLKEAVWKRNEQISVERMRAEMDVQRVKREKNEALRTQRENAKAREDREKKRQDEIKENLRARNRKLREKNEALKEKHQEYKDVKKENAEKKRRIAQIAGIHKRLLEKLDTPKDTKHLPDGYAPLVSNVLSMFDFTTEGMDKWAERNGEPSKRYRYLDELRKKLEELSKEDSKVKDEGIEIDPELIELVDELKADIADSERLSDMDSAKLEDIVTLFRAFEHQINTYNQAIDDRNKQTVTENRDNFISDVRDKKTRKDRQGTIGWLQRQLETNNTTPEDFFHLIGGTPEKLYKSIRKGFDKHILNVKSAMDFIEATVDSKDVKKWSENVREYTTSFGDKIKLTDAQLMSVYCLSRREQAQQHMYSEKGGGGIVVAPQKVGKGLKAEEIDRAKVVVNSSDIQKWISQLSKKQIEVADQFQRYLSEDMSKLGNETSLKLYGYKKFTEKYYFPIQSSDNWLNSTFDFSGGDAVLKNVGMTKAVNKHANAPIVIDDIFTVATKHISTMSLYNSLVPSLTDFQRFWNSKDRDHGTTVKEEFERVYGKPALRYVDNFMRDLNGSYKRGFEVEGVDKLMSKYKQASIGLNLRVLFQQPTAVARAGAVMNPIYITKALGASTTTLKQNLKDMREHCPIALWKSWGFYNTDLARDMRSIMMNEKTFSDNFSKAYGIADDLTWSVIFKAVRYEVEAQNKNLKVGSDEYWEKVNERASEVFDRTQVVDSPFHRSQNMRAKDNLSKMVTAFMAEPTKTYNMLKTELTLAKREIQSGQKAQGIKRASRVVQVFVTNALLVSASSAVIDALRGVGGSGDDDKDKNWFERFLAHWWTNTKDNINPLGLLPVFKDVQSIVNGYDVTRMDMQSISRMIQSLQKMGEYIKSPEESKYTLANEVDYFAQQASYVVGIPYANFRRDARGIAFSIAEAVGYDDLFFEEAKFKYQMNETAKSKNQFVFMELYLDALNKGDATLANKIKKYMTDNGVTEDYFKEKINADKKDNKSASQQHKFDSSIQTLEASPIWTTSSEDNKEYYTGILENISVGIENQSTEYVTKLAKNGLTNEQVILYKLALKKVDKPNKNGKLGGTPTNAEKEDAIRLLERYYNLTQAQKDTLMGK